MLFCLQNEGFSIVSSLGDPTPRLRLAGRDAGVWGRWSPQERAVLEARLGAAAVEALGDGEPGTMVGVKGEETRRLPLEEVVAKEHQLDPGLYRLARILAEMPE